MVGCRQRELVLENLAGLDGRGMLQARPVASSEDVSRDHQLVAAECRLMWDLGGIYIDELYDPVRICARRRGMQMNLRLAGNSHRGGENGSCVDEHIGSI